MTSERDPELEDTPPTSAELQPSPEAEVRPSRQPWRLRDLFFFLVFVAVSFVAMLILSLVVSIAYVVLAPLVGWTLPLLDLQKNVLYLLTLQLVWYVLLLAYIYFLVTMYYRLPFWRGLNWQKITGHSAVRFLLGGAALSMVVMVVPPFLPESKGFPLQKMFNSPSSAYAVAVFAVLLAPFVEELVFRGLLFAFFEKNGGLTFAIAGTAFLFALLHIPEYWGAWDHVVMILIVGIVFSVVRGMTRSVTPSYLLHLAYNGTLMALLYFQTQHFQHFPGGPHF